MTTYVGSITRHWVSTASRFRPSRGTIVEVKFGTAICRAKFLGRRRFFKSFRPEWRLTVPVTDFRVEYWRYDS